MPARDKQRARTGRVGLKEALAYGVLVCLTFVFVAFVCVRVSIRSSVEETARLAVDHYPGDRIEALMEYADSSDHSLTQRNRAVWALGQIGDKRALPLLEKYWTGKPCEHDTTLCQREVAKAMKACKGTVNAPAWLFR
jgi:HEAT repeat protein